MLKKIKLIYTIYHSEGLNYLYHLFKSRLINQKTKSLPYINTFIGQGNGLEIGGPSLIFNDNALLPIYKTVNKLDNCNFHADTLWSVQQINGEPYIYHSTRPKGLQIVDDASTLSSIPDESYEFILSSHVLEHIANPIKALHEWKRIIKPDGHLVIIIPHKDGTFDRKRPITTLKHLIYDFENNTQEDDLTHLKEILKLHDFSRDIEAGTFQNFMERSKNNLINRALHHHVFNTLLVTELLNYVGLEIKIIEAVWPMHIIAVVQKISMPNNHTNNAEFNFFKSPFPSDRPKTC